MNLFVYEWEVLNENPIKIQAHTLKENGEYFSFNVEDFKMFGYYELKKETEKTVQMATSDDIYTKRNFIKKESRFLTDLKNLKMAELPIIAMFTAEREIDFVGWIIYNNGIIKHNQDIIIHPPIKILSFDIEVSSSTEGMPVPYREKDKIEMIGVVIGKYKKDESKKIIICYETDKIESNNEYLVIKAINEMDMIDKFFNLIKTENPDLITGFNIYGFDFDYIVNRLRYYQHYTSVCSRTGKTFFHKKMDWESAAYGSNKYEVIKIPGRIVFDMYLYFKRQKLEQYTLNNISKTFLNEEKHDISYKEMSKIFKTRENIQKVAEYCIQDAQLPLKLFNIMNVWNELCELAKITRCNIEEIYTRGEQLKVKNQMIKECIKRNVVMTKRSVKKQVEYEGASVINPVKGTYDNCAVLDFQSLYPSIIIAYNICPSTEIRNFSPEIEGLFPKCIVSLLEERKKIKETMKNVKDRLQYIVLDKKQNALKICANSMYGTMGYAKNEYLGSILCAKEITRIGRITLEKTIENIKNNFPVNIIYGDTDSCMVQFKEEGDEEKYKKLCYEICEYITKTLPHPMKLNFEEFYKTMILLSKKRYIMITNNDKIKYKGIILARRGYCNFSKNIYQEVIHKIIKKEKKEQILEYIKNQINKLKNGDVKKEDMIMTKSVKEPESYVSDVPQAIMAKRLIKEGELIESGARIEYVFVEEEKEKQGYKMYKLEELEQKKKKIDYFYYIEKQIQKPIDDLLETINVKDYVKNIIKREK